MKIVQATSRRSTNPHEPSRTRRKGTKDLEVVCGFSGVSHVSPMSDEMDFLPSPPNRSGLMCSIGRVLQGKVDWDM